MLIAGPCSYIDDNDKNEIWQTAIALKDYVNFFRCKIWLGGTSLEKYIMPQNDNRLELLCRINREIMPVMIEVHTPEHINKCVNLGIDHLWIGARNSSNYSLLEKIAAIPGNVFIKRGPAMTVDELIGIYDIMKVRNNKTPFIIERGICTIDRTPLSRWGMDLKGIIRIKHERKDIFENLVVDCSHSVGFKTWIEDHYKACRAVDVNHFMFEVTASGYSRTDTNQMLSVAEFKKIIGG